MEPVDLLLVTGDSTGMFVNLENNLERSRSPFYSIIRLSHYNEIFRLQNNKY